MRATHEKPLAGKRILVCGKGGSGKSSLVSLLARALEEKGYDVLALDGDASNPGGLARLLLGPGAAPKPLIDFFGGRACVTCPVDDPSPLTRKGDTTPLTQRSVALDEIEPCYIRRTGRMTLLQVGKIHEPYEGCDGPMSKVTRDFMVSGESVTLIDVEAGIEHFGRGVERHVDAVLVVVDPTFESFTIAGRVAGLCRGMEIGNVWAILNKVESDAMELQMRNALKEQGVHILGLVHQDPGVMRAGLTGAAIGACAAGDEVRRIARDLESAMTFPRIAQGSQP
jgi:CO dehydrogenase maturation factor